MRRVDGLLGNVDVARHEHPLPHRDQVSDSSIKSIEEAEPEIITAFVSIGWTVYSNEHEGWEFKHDTPSFGVQYRWVNRLVNASALILFAVRVRVFRDSGWSSQLLKSRVSANLLVFWEIAERH
jgi:hypothetical protein